jgi:hypothetical protein
MKQLTTIILSLFAFCIIFTQCDKIEGNPIDGSLALNAEFDANGRELRKILLEDYTGQGCGNCPVAAVKSKELIEIFGNRIIPVAVHAGFFADPTFFNYANLSTEEGTVYDTEFGNSNAGNPNGLVNRIDNDNSKVFFPTNWSSAIGGLLNEIAPLTIQIETEFSSDRVFTVSVNGAYVKTLDGNYNIIASIVEDSIIDAQHFYKDIEGRTEDAIEYDYVHSHVLRGNINGTWGSPFSAGEIKETYELTLPEYTLNSSWKKKNVAVIVYVYDVNTKEILHASQSHLLH